MRTLNHESDILVNTNVIQKEGLITYVITLADRVKHLRTKLKLTQPKLAEKAGVTQSTISNIEKGIRKRPREIVRIAEALRVNPQWLETGKGSETPVYPSSKAENNDFSSIEQALEVLLVALSKLDMNGRERIAPLLESFARSPGEIIKHDICHFLEHFSTGKSTVAKYKTNVQKSG